jgi:hypothetical protein
MQSAGGPPDPARLRATADGIIGFAWQARRDEPGRGGTRQHADLITFGNSSSQLTDDGLAAIPG